MIAIVEDDADTAALIAQCLSELGQTSTHFSSAEALFENVDALKRMQLFVIDVGLPGMNGIQSCARLRESGNTVPICILSSRAREVDVVLGLEAGADDYVIKPIRSAEFIARVRALLRRAKLYRTNESQDVSFGPLELDPHTHEIRARGVALELTKTEFDLLAYLMRSRGGICTKDQLLENVLGYSSSSYEGTLGVHISRLRKKLDEALGDNKLLSTVWGVGYRLSSDAANDHE